jgi:hypothetical protein
MIVQQAFRDNSNLLGMAPSRGPRLTFSAMMTASLRLLRINRKMTKIGLGLATTIFLTLLASGQDDTATLNFLVLKDNNGKPIRNASVVMHPVQKTGKQARGGLQIKTDADGKASFDGVPYGKLRVQVLASGFQTFGDDYAIDKPAIDITVKMKRPAGQYSIYEEHPEEKKEDSQKPPEKDTKGKPQ